MIPLPRKAEEDENFQVYTRAADIWSAMYHDCRRAEKSIELEQYILMDDRAGHRYVFGFFFYGFVAKNRYEKLSV